jgi:hypothetical protein
MTFAVSGVVSSKNRFHADCVYKHNRVGGGVAWNTDPTPDDVAEANALITQEVVKRLGLNMKTGFALVDPDQVDQAARDFVENDIVPPGTTTVPWRD